MGPHRLDAMIQADDDLILRLLLGWLAAYHLSVGTLAMFRLDLARRFARRAYGLTLPSDEAAVFLLRPLGAYALALGTMLTVACTEPSRHRAVIDGTALLLVLRVVVRVQGRKALERGLGLDRGRNGLNILLLLLQAGALLALRPR